MCGYSLVASLISRRCNVFVYGMRMFALLTQRSPLTLALSPSVPLRGTGGEGKAVLNAYR